MPPGVERKLTTILAADAEGYTRLMDVDEVRTLGALHAARSIFSKFIERHRGRIANTAGDGLIAEFPSVVEAVQCAIEVQRELGFRGHAKGGDLRFRIGVHLGDVIVDGDDLLGEGVNLASRLQTMAEPGGILISQQVYDQVYAKLSVEFEFLGDKRLKNIAGDVAVYNLSLGKKRAWSKVISHAVSRRPKDDAAHGSRMARRSRTGTHAAPAHGDLRARVIRNAILLGVIWVLLFVIDLTTGPPFWANWPGLAMVVLLGFQAGPLLARGRLHLLYARGLVIIGGLALINIFTWSGYPWVMWPAGALIAVELIRRLKLRSR